MDGLIIAYLDLYEVGGWVIDCRCNGGCGVVEGDEGKEVITSD